MGLEVAERGDRAAEATGALDHAGRDSEPAGPSVGLQVTQDRILIRADREDRAPRETASGLYVAQSLAAAVDGSDTGDSWFVGTIVQLGPQVRRLDVREIVTDWLQELVDEYHNASVATAEIKALRERILCLPKEHIDPLSVGDRVIFSWASGQQVAIGDDKYVVLRADDVLAVLDEDDE